MPKQPYEESQLAKFVDRRVRELKPTKTQAEIAAQAGFNSQNMITMIKQGRSKLALDRVTSLARALNCDPAFLMRLALDQAIGSVATQDVLEVFGEPLTENEKQWLHQIRRATNNSDPQFGPQALRTLQAIFEN